MIATLTTAALIALSSPPPHEIHSTLTVASLDAGVLELRIRVFADDLSAIVATFAGRPVPADSSVREPELRRYVQHHVAVSDAAGRTIPLESCGVERVREVYLLCYRTPRPAGRAVAHLRNALLTDLHDDQVNVVQFVAGSKRRSTLLTRATPSSPIPARD